VEEFVALGCPAETLCAVAEGLTAFGAIGGAPEWLLACVWLCVRGEQYLATASAQVLGDGFIARPLNIDTLAEFKARTEAEVPDIGARLHVLGYDTEVPANVDVPARPASLRDWPASSYSTLVLVRVSQRESLAHRVACGLLFTSDSGSSLLVGADVSTMAMVLSQDPELIDRYRQACEALTPAEYLRRIGS
jgi:hypothetical protein